MINHIKTGIENPTQTGIKSVGLKSMADKIDQYWEIIKPNAEIAMILDPRQKLDLIEQESEKEHAREELNNIFMKYKSKIELEQKEQCAPSSKKASTSSEIVTKVKEKVLSLAQRAFADKNKLVSQESELGNYLLEPRILLGEDEKILVWWKNNQTKFPILSKIARDYLAMQASSVPSERGFSSSGLTVTDMRSRLHPMTVRSLMCLKSWFKLGLN